MSFFIALWWLLYTFLRWNNLCEPLPPFPACANLVYFQNLCQLPGFHEVFPSTWSPCSSPPWSLSAAVALRPHCFSFTLNMLIATVRLHAFRERALFITASPTHLLFYYVHNRLSGKYLVVMLLLRLLYTVRPILISLFSSPDYNSIYQFHTVLIIDE